MAAAFAFVFPGSQAAARIGKDTITINATGFTASTNYVLELVRPGGGMQQLVTSDATGAFTASLVPDQIGAVTVNAYPVRTLTRFGSPLGATSNYVLTVDALTTPSATATGSITAAQVAA
jgi:hypothetical protein